MKLAKNGLPPETIGELVSSGADQAHPESARGGIAAAGSDLRRRFAAATLAGRDHGEAAGAAAQIAGPFVASTGRRKLANWYDQIGRVSPCSPRSAPIRPTPFGKRSNSFGTTGCRRATGCRPSGTCLERFGVTRSSVREALAVLDAMRITERKPKSGIYLRNTLEDSGLDALVLQADLGCHIRCAGDARCHRGAGSSARSRRSGSLASAAPMPISQSCTDCWTPMRRWPPTAATWPTKTLSFISPWLPRARTASSCARLRL